MISPATLGTRFTLIKYRSIASELFGKLPRMDPLWLARISIICMYILPAALIAFGKIVYGECDALEPLYKPIVGFGIFLWFFGLIVTAWDDDGNFLSV